MYRIVVSDLDGTLLNSNHKISNYTKKIIKILKEKGIKFILATGRHHLDTIALADEIGNDFYLITNNGAKILYKSESVITEFIENNVLKELLNFKVSPNISKNIFTEKGWYTDKYIGMFMDKHLGTACEPQVADLNLMDEKVIKFFFMGENIKEIYEIEKNLKNQTIFYEKLSISTSEKYCLEVTAKGVNKGEALKKILSREKINFADVIAFGDGFNDKEMLSFVGKGIIAENSNNKELKKILFRNETVDNSFGDGVADYLKKIYEL